VSARVLTLSSLIITSTVPAETDFPKR